MIGIVVENNDDFRKLKLNDEVVATGTLDNRLGIYVKDGKLFFDGNKISDQSIGTGIYVKDGKLFFNGAEISQKLVPDEPTTYWIPPAQEQSTYKPWSYAQLIEEYDRIMVKEPTYMKKYRYEKNSVPVKTKNGSYELYHYELVPKSYSKTFFITVGVHGNEMDAKQQMLRIVDILVNKVEQPEYQRFKCIRNDARLIIIPCVSPYGHDNATMNIPYEFEGATQQYGINPNRNYDFDQQFYIPGTGVGGYPEFCIEETQHVRDVLNSVGAENVDYAMDWHDGGNVNKHYWINYSVDSVNRMYINDFVSYLVNKYNIENPIIDQCKDTSTTGIASMYYAKTMGINASTVEWIGGMLGYDFSSEMMTMSMEIRANMILMGYEKDIKSWNVDEKPNAKYFHFDYPKAFTRSGLRIDGSDTKTIVTDKQIYDRWDNLIKKYPNYMEKSSKLGENTEGTQDIFTYTFGNGDKKILYIGGIMRYGAPHKIDEFAIYELVEYLCNDYIVNQSALLQKIRKDYKIIVLPCIDNRAGNSDIIKNCGLNNMALAYAKWQIVDGKCVPTNYALSINDIPILKNLIDENIDAKCIISGGEILTGYGGNSTEYSTDFETQFIIPKNQAISQELNLYVEHLIKERNENVIVEHTVGTTFGDYAFDNFGIPTYFIQLNVSKKYEELKAYHTLSEDRYLYGNYEAGRRMANIANIILNTN